MCTDDPEIAIKVLSTIKTRDMNIWNGTVRGVVCTCYERMTVCNTVPAGNLQAKVADTKSFFKRVVIRPDGHAVSAQDQVTSAESTITPGIDDLSDMTTFQPTTESTSAAQIVTSTDLLKIIYPVMFYVIKI